MEDQGGAARTSAGAVGCREGEPASRLSNEVDHLAAHFGAGRLEHGGGDAAAGAEPGVVAADEGVPPPRTPGEQVVRELDGG